MFTGVGGFELGIQQAYDLSQFKIKSKNSTDSKSKPSQHMGRPLCVGFSEIDKYANQLLSTKFPETKNYGDATKIDERQLPDFDLLVGGFPCQSFSIAGKRHGFDDTRGTLFFDIARILSHKKPRNILLENVKGLLSHDGGQTFQTIIGVLTDLGYFVEWQVLNSKNFGVPQNRERVFVIGYLGGVPRSKVFPVGEDGQAIDELQRHITNTLTARYGGAGAVGTYIGESKLNAQEIKQINQPAHSNDRVYGEEGISPTLNTMQGGRRQPKVAIPVLTPDRPEKRQNGRRFKTDGEPAFTLTGQDIHGVMVNEMAIRRLTPLECERLQGFPEIEKYVIIKVCLDNQKNLVNVENQNHKSLKPVGSVEKSGLKEIVLSVENNLNIKNQLTDKLVLPDVLINCEESKVEIVSQGKSICYVNSVEELKKFHPLIKKEDFVHLAVIMISILEKIINSGEVESLKKEECLIVQPNGKKLVRLFGKEIMLPVEDVGNDLIILKELLKSTTSNLLDIKNLEQKLTILSSFVIRAINGYIPKEIQNQNTFTIGIKTSVGWTYDFSDTQRYKMMGNAVTVNVVYEIMKRL